MEKEKIRLDKYLWAIRLFKTRTVASTACDKGRVKMNGESIKASRIVKLEDVYEVKTDEKKWVIKVTGLLANRVQYSEAVKFYEDQTPIEEKERIDNKLDKTKIYEYQKRLTGPIIDSEPKNINKYLNDLFSGKESLILSDSVMASPQVGSAGQAIAWRERRLVSAGFVQPISARASATS